MPRPYKALQKQGYKHYFTALTGRTRIADIAIIHSKTSLSVIAGEACLAHSCFLSFLLCKCVEDFPAFGTAGYEFFESGAELFTKRIALHGGALLACLYEFQM